MVLEYEVTDSYHQVGSDKTYYVYGADGRGSFIYCNGNPVKYTDPWGLEVAIKENELMDLPPSQN